MFYFLNFGYFGALSHTLLGLFGATLGLGLEVFRGVLAQIEGFQVH
jgi:hypothetical protein